MTPAWGMSWYCLIPRSSTMKYTAHPTSCTFLLQKKHSRWGLTEKIFMRRDPERYFQQWNASDRKMWWICAIIQDEDKKKVTLDLLTKSTQRKLINLNIFLAHAVNEEEIFHILFRATTLFPRHFFLIWLWAGNMCENGNLTDWIFMNHIFWECMLVSVFYYIVLGPSCLLLCIFMSCHCSKGSSWLVSFYICLVALAGLHNFAVIHSLSQILCVLLSLKHWIWSVVNKIIWKKKSSHHHFFLKKTENVCMLSWD